MSALSERMPALHRLCVSPQVDSDLATTAKMIPEGIPNLFRPLTVNLKQKPQIQNFTVRFETSQLGVQRVSVTQATHSTHRGSFLILIGDELIGGESAVETIIGFKKDVQELLGGNNSWVTHVLIVSIIIQVTHWFSDTKTTAVYDPSRGS